MTGNTAARTDSILADLLWKLRLRLEAEGQQSIDIQQLRKDADYRNQCLEQAETSGNAALMSLAQAVRKRTRELNGQADGSVAGNADKGGRTRLAIAAAAVCLAVTIGAFFFLNGSEPAPTASGNPPVSATNPQPILQNTSQNTSVPQPKTDGAPTPPKPPRTLFRMHGSNTVGEKLAPALVTSYLAAEGAEDIALKTTEVDVEKYVTATLEGEPVRVEIHAHGSSTGFADLDGETTDIAMASRRVKEKEVSQLADRYGDLSLVSNEHVLALDGLAVIVNPALPVEELTTATIAELFAGTITNWQSLGGPDLEVNVFARDENSGTWDTFKSLVLKPNNASLAASARRFESSNELSDLVASTPGAIGFIGLPYVRQAKLVAVSEGGDALPSFPTNFTVSTEDYPLSRRLYLYLPANTDNGHAHAFINFANSRRGQDVVENVGLISQNIDATRPPVLPDLPEEYVDTTRGAERLSVNIRFETGSDRIDNKGQRDLGRIADFLSDNPDRRVMLLGFTDNIGDPRVNTQLSEERARVVGQDLMKLGIYPTLMKGFGQVAPVASNDSDEGRLRNRRVEIWVL